MTTYRDGAIWWAVLDGHDATGWSEQSAVMRLLEKMRSKS